ncbi:MAG: tetratricopeptide repeat protein [Rhodocyclaceae bacterium]|nr:tetratricopeptide repeat protein [Rhodocyclaceae bacterium]
MDFDSQLKLCQQAIRAEQFDAARAYCRAALGIDPDDPAALNLLGVIHRRAGRLADAEATLRRALAKAPDSAALHRNLGLVALARGNHDEALASLRAALERQPESAGAHASLARACARAGRLEEAALHFAEARMLEPDVADHPLRQGRVLLRMGRIGDAEEALSRSRSLKVGPAVLSGLAQVAMARHELREAEAYSRLALAFDPRHTDTLATLAMVLNADGHAEDAANACERALARDPAHAEAMAQLALAQRTLGLLDAADESHRCARALAPADPRHRVAHAHTLIAMGRDSEGWALMDHGRRNAQTPAFPRWRGENLSGRTLLLHTTCSADAIQFVRYAELLAGHGARVVVRGPAPLVRLLATARGVAGTERSDRPGRTTADYQCPMNALPKLDVGPTRSLPPRMPYLQVPPDLPPRFIGGFDALDVGIAWRGAPGDSGSDVPLALLEPAMRMHGVRFHALQGPCDADEEEILHACRVRSDAVADEPVSVAAIVDGLDLVISADNALAHVAAAMGRPVWLLSHAGGDWRWQRGSHGSAWYPTLRHFWQGTRGDWLTVTGQVAIALARVVGGETELPATAAEGIADPGIRATDPARIAPIEITAHAWRPVRSGRLNCPLGQQPEGLAVDLYGEFCAAREEVLGRVLRRGDTMVLAGAGFGALVTALAKRLGPFGALHAFEADPANWELLAASCHANGWTQVVHRPQTLGAEHRPDTGTTTIDALRLPALSLLVVDLARQDSSCLQGAAETIRRCRPVIYLMNAGDDGDLLHGMEYRGWAHRPGLYNADNFAGIQRNVFGRRQVRDVLALPEEADQSTPLGDSEALA